MAVGDLVPPMRRNEPESLAGASGAAESQRGAEPDETQPADPADLVDLGRDAAMLPRPQPPEEAALWPALPDAFVRRVRALKPRTYVRIAFSVRATLCDITAGLIEGMNANSATAGALEEGRSKLLLAVIPKGASPPTEMRVRLDLWQSGRFEELLARIEVQQAASAGAVGAPTATTSRCRRLAQGGARRKAIVALTSETATLTDEQQRVCATELLPQAAAAYQPLPHLAPAPLEPDDLEGPPASPLRGVHFSPMRGTGPSGMRPEHLQDMLSCGRRRQSSRLLAALRVAQTLVGAGRLPDAWAATLRTRVIFLKKRHGPKPRPVRIGETMRGVLAKNKLAKEGRYVRRAMLDSQQYAVMLPGGGEPLIHARRCLREVLAEDPSLGAWLELDLDLENAFPSMEWPAVDMSMRELLPQLAHISEWSHQIAGIELPVPDADGKTVEHVADRGAEQGDSMASVQCGAVVSGVRRRTRESRMHGAPVPGPSYAHDDWFADDGHAVVRPDVADAYLRTLDAQLVQVGCKRSHAKSKARLLGHPVAIAALDPVWRTEYLTTTCTFEADNASTVALGVQLGSPQEVVAHFGQCASEAGTLRSAIETLDDPATELTLGRSCADVSKVNHLLRASGDILAREELQYHDDAVLTFVERVLGGAFPDHARDQAALGLRAGGLGFRPAADAALTAFLASCVEATPLVEHLCRSMDAEGLPANEVLARHQQHTDEAAARVRALLSPAAAATFDGLLRDSLARSHARLEAMLSSKDFVEPEGAEDDVPSAGGGLVGEAGAEDPEHERTVSVPRLQRRMAAVLDAERALALRTDAIREGRMHDVRRVSDLASPTVSNEWLWSLAGSSRHTLEPDVFVDACRLRLGANTAADTDTCYVCGKQCRLSGEHALCCAPGPSTSGHNDVRDCVLAVARRGDPHAEREASGLLPAAQGLRPADVLTYAAGGSGLWALDVGVASPDSLLAVAHGDALEAMRVRKERVYEPYLAQMETCGLEYRALPWSSWGREHEGTTRTLTVLCKRAARRSGSADWRLALRLLRADVGVALARRASAMWRQCAFGAAAHSRGR